MYDYNPSLSRIDQKKYTCMYNVTLSVIIALELQMLSKNNKIIVKMKMR